MELLSQEYLTKFVRGIHGDCSGVPSCGAWEEGLPLGDNALRRHYEQVGPVEIRDARYEILTRAPSDQRRATSDALTGS